MACRFSEIADRVDEHERRGPSVGLVDTANPAVFELPPGQRAEALGNLGFVVCRLFLWHDVTTPNPKPAFHITTPPPTRIVWP